MHTLVVNHAYEPVQVIGWQKAVYLLVTEKADLLVAYDKVVRSVSVAMSLPKVVRLKKYVRLKLRERGVFRKRDVFERDGWECLYCGTLLSETSSREALRPTLDHVVPRSRGGKTSFENSATACGPCNSKKANRTPEEAGMKLRRVPAKPKSGPGIRPELKKAYDAFLKESTDGSSEE